MEKHNNHFVPRLILRRFDEKITVYNLKTKKLLYDQKLEKIFQGKDIYTQEIEDLFNLKIENEFARILNNNILMSENSCRFTRIEVNLIKKFLLLGMLRTMDGEKYSFHLKDRRAITVKTNFKFEEKNTEDISAYDYWMRTLKSILESTSLNKVYEHPLATNLAVYWANVYNSTYISIWDSANTKEDFLVMDQGMTSEHEKTRFIEPYHNDVIKKGYLLDKTIYSDHNSESIEVLNAFQIYLRILFANDTMTENVYLFSISKTRMITLINPFYRLYDKNTYENTSFLPTPDIWVTNIKNKKLFLKNKNEYINDLQKDVYNEKDVFIYDIHEMDLLDVIYINCLVLDRIHDYVGFSESKGIIRSVLAYMKTYKPRIDYNNLLKEFELMGYDIGINNSIKVFIKENLSGRIKFSNREIYYADLFVKYRSESNSQDK